MKDNMEERLHKRALLLSYFTVAYNIIEGIVSVTAGMMAGSIALIGFGSDSFIESLSGAIMIWRFSKHGKISSKDEIKVEKRAIKLVGYAFLVLSLFVLYKSIETLYLREIPDASPFGIVIAIVSIIVMPLLYIMKYRTGKSISSVSLIADSKQTLACLFLSASLLIGLMLNYFYGFWQADPIIGLIIAGFLFQEGIKTIKEEKLCSC
ncbi:MAG TPA: cation transporter [Bacteroidales bacterium]|nr:cation transporter [Bacteroidales bacterium]